MNSFHLPGCMHLPFLAFPDGPEPTMLNQGKEVSSQSWLPAERSSFLSWVTWMVSCAEPKLLQVLLFINMYQILYAARFFILFSTQIWKIR